MNLIGFAIFVMHHWNNDHKWHWFSTCRYTKGDDWCVSVFWGEVHASHGLQC